MIRLGVVMDPIAEIKVAKDSTFAMLLAAQARGWALSYMELADLFLIGADAHASTRALQVTDSAADWFQLGEPEITALADLDVILMRKDPPFDMEYIYSTYILERAEAQGTVVVNRPAGLRNANEKLATAWFPQCAPPSLVARRADQMQTFLAEHGDIILKPLGAMGGASIFRIRSGDPNTNVIIETLTGNGTRYAMAQRYIPEISAGDKRILLVDGIPVPYALARMAAPGETRANLATGGKGVGVELSERDYWICEQVAPALKDLGLTFVGLDVIGDYLTEVNSTSPTCIRELDALYGLDIAGQLMDSIERQLP